MPGRILTDAQRKWLLTELAHWRDSSIISTDQSDRILTLYESPSDISARKGARAIFTLLGIAAFLIALAVLLMIGYNWEDLSRGVKLVVILGFIALTHPAAYYLRYFRLARFGSEILFFLGCLLYGSGIWLVAQVFHINSHYPDGIYWWALGVLPFALALDTILHHLLLIGLLGVWAGVEVLHFPHLESMWFGGSLQIPNGAFTLLPMVLAGMVWAYRKGSSATISLYVPLLAWWSFLQLFAWHRDWSWNAIFFMGAIGALFCAISLLHAPVSRFGAPYFTWGATLVWFIFMLLGFQDLNEQMVKHPGDFGTLTGTFLIAALTLAVVAFAVFSKKPDPSPRTLIMGYSPWAAFLPSVTITLLAIWNSRMGILGRVGAVAAVSTVIANIAMIAIAYWVMQRGLKLDHGRAFAAGVFLFLAWAIMRYIDLFGDFGGMLGASLMFFLCGGALFAVAMYWKRRKEAHRGE